MNKRFLKSVAILGLTSTTLGMAQPVGAIVNGNYRLEKNIENDIKSIQDGTDFSNLHQKHLVKIAYQQLSKLLDEMGGYSTSLVYTDSVYKNALDELTSSAVTYGGYLTRLRLQVEQEGTSNVYYNHFKEESEKIDQELKVLASKKDLESKTSRQKRVKELKQQKSSLRYLVSGIDKLSTKKVNYLTKNLQDDLNRFKQSVYDIQIQLFKSNPSLYPYGQLYVDYLTKYYSRTDLKKQFVDDYGETAQKYLTTMENIFEKEDQINALYEAYKNTNLSDEVEELRAVKDVVLLADSKLYSDDYYNEIVNLKDASDALDQLNEEIQSFFKKIKKDVPDKLPRFSLYQYLVNYRDSSDKQKSYLKKVIEEVKEVVGSYAKETKEKTLIVQVDNQLKLSELDLPLTNKDPKSGYVILDEEYDDYYDNDGLLKDEFKKNKESKTKSSSKEMVLELKNETSTSRLIPQITVHNSVMPFYQAKRVETFTIESPVTFSGKNNSKTLSSLEGYGSTAVLGTIGGSNISNLSGLSGEKSLPYPQLIGGSNITPLVGSEGGYLNIELRTHASEAPVTSESTQNAQLSDESEKSDNVTITYKVFEPQETSQVSEEPKVIEEPSVQKSQEILDTSQVSEETKNKDSLDEYTKSQINFWIGDFSSTLNQLTPEQLADEKLEGLISRGQKLRKKLDNALGEGKYNGDLKRDLDQLETISNAISRIMENNTVTVAQ
ncbi:hypothetical protein [Streptococcus canis]|uniref:hypothetical protein n=1 Tax=Streptococcus canis TaxID=1329 RepID=UPI0013DA8CEE|nr:hypothetical protein [Streptococcus canis]QKG76795.1 hypothetical protein GE021_000785 [Streptococcus canis]